MTLGLHVNCEHQGDHTRPGPTVPLAHSRASGAAASVIVAVVQVTVGRAVSKVECVRPSERMEWWETERD